MAKLNPSLIAELREKFPNLVILTPESPEYEENMYRWNVAAEKRASAVIHPLSTQDVSGILAFVQAHGIEIAVCGAGHNHRGNSVDDGLVVDLRKMNAVSVDPVNRTIMTQGAAVWGSVYEAAGKHGLAAVGGLVPSVGVGGFTLNGGLGWLTSAHGVALDNLLEADVVLADGRILTCSEGENGELFWAIRGAGACFGIVTRFVFVAHEVQSLVWTGMMMFDKRYLEGVVDVVNRVTSEENEGTACICFGFFARDGEVDVGVLLFYNGPEVEARAYFAPLLEMEAKVRLMQTVPFSQSTIPHGSPPGRHWRKVTAGGCLVVPLEVKFIQSLQDEFEEFVKKVPDAQETIIACEMHNPSATMRKEQTSTAFPFRGRHGSVQIMSTWSLEENDEACWDWCRKVDEKIAREFDRRKNEEGMDETTRASVGTYINYDGLHKSPKALYGVNYERLVQLKKKYDPGNVFKQFVDLLAAE